MADSKTPRDSVNHLPAQEDQAPEQRFASSQPPAVMPPRTLPEWIRMFAACPHPENGVVAAVLAEENDTRLPFRWCGTCGAVLLSTGGDPVWCPPGLAIAFLTEDVFADFARNLDSLAKALAELLASARSIKGRIAPAAAGDDDLLERLRQFEVAAFEAECRARASVG